MPTDWRERPATDWAHVTELEIGFEREMKPWYNGAGSPSVIARDYAFYIARSFQSTLSMTLHADDLLYCGHWGFGSYNSSINDPPFPSLTSIFVPDTPTEWYRLAGGIRVFLTIKSIALHHGHPRIQLILGSCWPVPQDTTPDAFLNHLLKKLHQIDERGEGWPYDLMTSSEELFELVLGSKSESDYEDEDDEDDEACEEDEEADEGEEGRSEDNEDEDHEWSGNDDSNESGNE